MFQTSPETSFSDKILICLQILSSAAFAISCFVFQDEWAGFIAATDSGKASVKFWAFIGFLFSIILQGIISYFIYIQSTQTSVLKAEVTNLNIKTTGLETDLKTLKKEKESIEKSISEDVKAISRVLCKSIANELSFGSKPNVHERISIYAIDEVANCFLLISRYSVNTDLDSNGHSTYQKNLGNIGKVWQNVFCFENDYPSPNGKKYVTRTMRDGFTKEQVLKFRMKARLYSGYRISDSKQTPLAVVMLEATDPDRWQKEYLKSYFEREQFKLTNLLEIIHPKVPKVSNARKKGF